VAAADEALGAVLRPLLAQGRAGNTLVVVTADHGESLGEHEERTHGVFAYEATLRVPLILFDPALLAPRTVADPSATWTSCPRCSTRSPFRSRGSAGPQPPEARRRRARRSRGQLLRGR
jgi:hypothetical protein